MVNADYIDQLIDKSGLQPGDAIWIGDRFLGMVEHHLIYLGREDSGFPLFVAAFERGVRYLTLEQLVFLVLHTAEARRNPFRAPEAIRQPAMDRMMGRLDRTTFRLYLRYCQDHQQALTRAASTPTWKKIALGSGLLGVAGGLAFAWKLWQDRTDD